MQILRTIVLLLTTASLATAAGPAAGDWTAVIKVRDISLRLALHVTEKAEGMEATFDSIDQKVLGLPVDKLDYKDRQLSFEIASIQAIYKGSTRQDRYEDHRCLVPARDVVSARLPEILAGETVVMMEAVVRNVLRLFAKSPVFVVTVVLIMALGIGSCTAIFSLVKEVLLTRLPYRDAGRLAIIWHSDASPPT
jgi:hypothetical protein